MVTDVDGEILYANATLFALLGSDLGGARTVDQLEEKSAAASPTGRRELVRALVSGQEVDTDFTIQPSGGVSIVRMRRREVTDDSGAVLARLVLVDDVTELRSRETYQKQIMAIASHDLRNPLSAITMNAGILSRLTPMTDDRRIKTANRIGSSAARLARMIDDLFDYTLATLGKGIPLRVASADLAIIAKDAAAESRFAHPGREVQLKTQGDLQGMWDADRLHQVLQNLLSNAMKYGDPADPIRVDCHEADDEASVVCSVFNQGEPIAAALLPHIFDAYRQGADAGRQGLGLGLHIVRRILDAHQGTVAVTSSREGTWLTFHLPRTTTPD